MKKLRLLTLIALVATGGLLANNEPAPAEKDTDYRDVMQVPHAEWAPHHRYRSIYRVGEYLDGIWGHVTNNMWADLFENPSMPFAFDTYGKTALHMAAEHGDANLVQRLVQAGTDVDVNTYLHPNFHYSLHPEDDAAGVGETPLYLAVADRRIHPHRPIADRVATIQRLIELGANVDQPNLHDGRTALDAAGDNQALRAVLLAHGAHTSAELAAAKE